MSDREKLRPPITADHFMVFGQIIVGYAACEIALRSILAGMLGIDQWALHVLTDRMNSQALLAKMKAVNSHVDDPERQAKVADLIRQLEKAATLRNEIAHGSWMPSQRSGAIRPTGLSVKAKGVNVLGFDNSEKDYSLDELKAWANELLALGTELQAYYRTLRAT